MSGDSKKPFAVNRRHFLKGAGSFTLSIPFLTSFAPSDAVAQTIVDGPTNFIGIDSGNGAPRQDWWPTQPATTVLAPYVRELSLTSIAGNISTVFGAEWNPYKSKLLMVRGLDGIAQCSHNDTFTLTGYARINDNNENVETENSIDEVLASSPKFYSAPPQMRSLNLSLSSGKTYGSSFKKVGSTLIQNPTFGTPLDAFNEVFRPQLQSVDPTSAAARDMRNKKVIDNVLGHYRQIMNSPKLSAQEKPVLESFADMLSQLENRLRTPATSMACTIPPTPAAEPFPYSYKGYFYSQYTPDQLSAYLDLTFSNYFGIIAAALQCGITKASTFNLYGGWYYNFLTGITSDHHAISHALNGTLPDRGRAENARIYNYIAKKVAVLVQKLDVPAVGGSGSLLDKTVILWGNELADYASHGRYEYPIVLVGGGNKKLKMGRLLDYRTDTFKYSDYSAGVKNPYDRIGRPYNQLLESVLQSFGLTPEEYSQNGKAGFGDYGEFAACPGDPKVRAQYGDLQKGKALTGIFV
jgi:hypothetical protein